MARAVGSAEETDELTERSGSRDQDVATAATPSPRRASGARGHALGLSWVLGSAFFYLLPALLHGTHLGPFDILSTYGVTKQPRVTVHNNAVNDQIDAIMPWTTLAWTQIHHGHLPLWNPYNALGAPLAFNWQSGAFGLPALVGYLVPVQYAYTVGIVVTLVIAGTGAYFFGAVLRLSALGCAMAGTVYELSGPVTGWLGWPHAAVMSWAGWLFGATVLIVRERHRVRGAVLFAVALAWAIYAGQPEILVLLVFGLGIFFVALLVQTAWRKHWRPVVRPLVTITLAGVCGAALAAPLALPGAQVVSGAVRNIYPGGIAIAPRAATLFVAQGYYGLPLPGNGRFLNYVYQETAVFVGVIAIVLAVMALATRWRQRELRALAVLAVVALAIAYVQPVTSVMGSLPAVGSVAWHRLVFLIALAVALLAGAGLDALLRDRRGSWVTAGAGFALAVLVLLFFLAITSQDYPPVNRWVSERSVIWPILEAAVGLAAVGGVLLAHRRRTRRSDVTIHTARADESPSESHERPLEDRGLAAWAIRIPFWNCQAPSKRWRIGVLTVLLACETIALIAATAPLWSSSPTFFKKTPAEAKLERIVGSSLVAIGGGPKHYSELGCDYMGVEPNVNAVSGLHELALYDPAAPSELFTTWTAVTGTSPGVTGFYLFCPFVKSVRIARRFGVQYLLEPQGVLGPTGTRFVATVGDEDLYRVPNSAQATLVALGSGGRLPADDAIGRPVAVSHPGPSSWRIETHASSPQLLRLRLTNVPGWHATIDGRPLALRPYSGLMLEAEVPPGHHVIELNYWPDRFTEGIVIGVIALLALVIVPILIVRRRRHSLVVEEQTEQ